MTQTSKSPSVDESANCTPVYLGKKRDLFAWFHHPEEQKYATPVVICNPLGFEYVRTYKTLRCLAGSLAAAGFMVVRFDYHGCGDSAGSDRDSGRVLSWLESIATAVEFAQEKSGSDEVSLVGLRMGATLAYKSTEKLPVSNLVLWNPCHAGSAFVRDMQIVEHANEGGERKAIRQSPEIAVDAAGFVITSETVNDLGHLQMAKVRPEVSPAVLLVERDDFPTSSRMLEWLSDQASQVDVARAPGHKQMMLAPQHSQVPLLALESIVNWLRERKEVEYAAASNIAALPEFARSGVLLAGNGVAVEEFAGRFGKSRNLFGVISTANSNASSEAPAVILLCGGAVHRVSANRMYVPLARRLASIGLTVLRMDVSGIGDSRSTPGMADNNPYTDSLCDDVQAAMLLLAEKFSSRRFVLLGLCSGAYAALETAKVSDKVVGLTLINQLVYFLPTSRDRRDSTGAAMPGAFDFPRKNTFFDRIARKVLRQTSKKLAWPSRLLTQRSLGGDLPAVFRGIAKRNVPIHFVFSAGDPSQDALQIFAGKTIADLLKKGEVSVSSVPNADHTFSTATSQDDVLNRIVENMEATWCAQGE